MLDMATQDPELVDSLRSQPGLTDIRSCHRAGSPAGSYHATAMSYPVIRGPEEGRRFVAEQIGFGADYIKIVLEDPDIPGAGTMTPDTIAAVAQAAHKGGRHLIAHAVASGSFKLALENGVDVITHTPMGECISATIVEEMAKRGILAVPTLVMMKGLCETFAELPSPPTCYSNSQESVARFRRRINRSRYNPAWTSSRSRSGRWRSDYGYWSDKSHKGGLCCRSACTVNHDVGYATKGIGEVVPHLWRAAAQVSPHVHKYLPSPSTNRLSLCSRG